MKPFLCLVTYATFPLESQKLCYFLNQRPNNYTVTTSDDECARKKKKKHGRINHEDMLVISYSGDVLWEEGDVSVKLQKCVPPLTNEHWHWRNPADISMGRVGSRKWAVAPIFLWWLILSFSPILWASLSFLYATCLSPLLSPSPFFPQRDEQMSPYTRLVLSLPFSLPWPLPVLVRRHHLNPFMFLSFPTWILGKTSSWNIWGWYSLHLSHFAKAVSI